MAPTSTPPITVKNMHQQAAPTSTVPGLIQGKWRVYHTGNCTGHKGNWKEWLKPSQKHQFKTKDHTVSKKHTPCGQLQMGNQVQIPALPILLPNSFPVQFCLSPQSSVEITPLSSPIPHRQFLAMLGTNHYTVVRKLLCCSLSNPRDYWSCLITVMVCSVLIVPSS